MASVKAVAERLGAVRGRLVQHRRRRRPSGRSPSSTPPPARRSPRSPPRPTPAAPRWRSPTPRSTWAVSSPRSTAPTGPAWWRSTRPPARSTTAFNLQLSGGIGVGGMLTVQELKLTHDDRKLMVVHTGRQIAGQDRYGVGPDRHRDQDAAAVAHPAVGGQPLLRRRHPARLRRGHRPQRPYFVVSSGSGGDRPPINDTAMAFPINGSDNVEPLWVSRMFDSVYSVAITEVAVYVGGHFSWQESPTSAQPWPGLDNVGYGTGQGLSGYGLGDQVVRRDHVGALNPTDRHGAGVEPGLHLVRGREGHAGHPARPVRRRRRQHQGRQDRRPGRRSSTSPSCRPRRRWTPSSTAPIEGQVKAANSAVRGQRSGGRAGRREPGAARDPEPRAASAGCRTT